MSEISNSKQWERAVKLRSEDFKNFLVTVSLSKTRGETDDMSAIIIDILEFFFNINEDFHQQGKEYTYNRYLLTDKTILDMCFENYEKYLDICIGKEMRLSEKDFYENEDKIPEDKIEKNATTQAFFERVENSIPKAIKFAVESYLDILSRANDEITKNNIVRKSEFSIDDMYLGITLLIFRQEMYRIMSKDDSLISLQDEKEKNEQLINKLKEENNKITMMVSESKNENLKLKQQIYKLTIDNNNKASISCQKEENHKLALLEKQIKQLEEELQIKNEKIEELNAEIEEINEEEEVSNLHELPEINYEARYLFVGGHPATFKRLKNVFPNSDHLSGETSNEQKKVNYFQYDLVIFITTNLKHCLFNKVKNVCIANNIPYLNTCKKAADLVAIDIFNYNEAQEKKVRKI